MAGLFRGSLRRQQRSDPMACGGRLGSRPLRRSGLSLSVLLAVLLFTATWLAAPGAQQRAPVPAAQRPSRWSFQPLGPEGAALEQLCHLDRRRWIARSASGELFLWEPPTGDGRRDSSGATTGRHGIPESGQATGVSGRLAAWERLALPAGERAVLVGVPYRPGQGLVLLDAGGGLWIRAFDSARAETIAAPAISSSAGDSLAGSGRPADRDAARAADWRRIGALPPAQALRAIDLLPAPGSSPSAPRVLVATREGIFHRCGATATRSWAARFPPAGDSLAAAARRPTLRNVHALPGHERWLLALSEWEGLFISRDGGRSFLPASAELPKQVRAVLPPLVPGGVAYAVAGQELYRGRAGGTRWELVGRAQLATAERSSPILALHGDASAATGRLWAITAEGALWRSDDGGVRWLCRLPAPPAPVFDLESAGDELRLATGRGCYAATAEGHHWTWRNRGLRRISVRAIGTVSAPLSGPGLGANGAAAEVASASVTGSDGPALAGMPRARGNAAIARAPRTRDVDGNPTSPGSAERQDGHALDHPGGLWLRTDLGAYWSEDGGRSWQPRPAAWADSLVRRREARITALAESLTLPARVRLLDASRGGVAAWLATDDGLWRRAPTALRAVAFRGERLLAVAASRSGPEWLFVRTGGGLFASHDQGDTWQVLPVPHGVEVTHLAVDESTHRLLLGTLAHGLFATEIPDPRPVLVEPLPIQISPNPFGETVMLRCPLPPTLRLAAAGEPHSATPNAEASLDPSQAELRIFSVHGQLVRRISGATLVGAGASETGLVWRWDGLNERGQPVSSGMYLVTAALGEQHYRGKVIKLR